MTILCGICMTRWSTRPLIERHTDRTTGIRIQAESVCRSMRRYAAQSEVACLLRRGEVLDSEVVGQCELDLCEPSSCQVVDGVAHDIVDVDRANLVDQHPRRPTGDFKLGAVNRRAGRG